MDNVSPSAFAGSFVTSLNEGWAWAIIAIVVTVVIYILTRRDTSQLNNEIKENIDKSRKNIEECIEKRIHIREIQEQPIGILCNKILYDAKQLQNASSNYDRGLSKAASRDFAGAEAEFKAGIDLQLPMLSKYYYIGSAEGHESPNLQVGDEVNPRRFLR